MKLTQRIVSQFCARFLAIVGMVSLLLCISLKPAYGDDEEGGPADPVEAPEPAEPAEPSEPAAVSDSPSDDGGGGDDDGGGGGGPSGPEDAPAKTVKDDEPVVKDPAWFKEEAPVELSKAEKEKICKTYEGKFISYYNQIFKVTHCQRESLLQEGATLMNRKGTTFHEVDYKVMDSLPLKVVTQSIKVRSCAEFNGHYVYQEDDSSTYYLVENCKKRLFTDSESYKDHKAKNKSRVKTIGINEKEFLALKSADSMPSVLDKEFKQRLSMGTDEIIPLSSEAACKGLIGRHVSYCGMIYLITKDSRNSNICQKEEVEDGAKYTRQFSQGKLSMTDLSTERFISIPSKQK